MITTLMKKERWRRIAILIIGLGFSISCTSQDDFAEVAPVELVITPLDIIFPAVTIDDEAIVPIIFQNTGEATAHISFTLTEDPNGEEENTEFVWQDPTQTEGFLEVPGGQTASVNLVYRPLDIHQDFGTLLVNYDNNGSASIPLTTFKIEPNLDISPPRVVFERVRSGESADRTILLKNDGPALLQLNRLRFDEDQGEEFLLCAPGPDGDQVCATELTGLKVPFTEELPIIVRYSPSNDGEDTIGVLIESNDPDTPMTMVEVVANLAVPCLSVNPAEGVDFGLSLIGNQAARTVTLINCSRNTDLELRAAELTSGSDPTFGLILLPDATPPLTLQPGSSTSVAVSYAPDAERTHEATLRILSNDPAWSELELPLRGEGSLDGVCPNTEEVCDGIDNDCDGQIDEEPKEEICDNQDNDCDDIVDEYCPEPFEEQFEATEEIGSTPVDFIMAVDTSGSMGDTVQVVADNLSDFVERMVNEGVDLQLTLIADNSICIPEPLAGPNCGDNTNFRHLQKTVNSNDALDVLLRCVDGPCAGGEYRTKLRPGSLRQLMVVTDDESTMPWAQFQQGMDAAGIGDFIFHGIVGLMGGDCVDRVGEQYITGAQETDGELLHVCDRDWGVVINALFDATASRLQMQFPLTYVPVPDTVQVRVAPPGEPAEAATEVPGTWGYNARNNRVVFLLEHPPALGSTVVISYDFIEEEQTMDGE